MLRRTGFASPRRLTWWPAPHVGCCRGGLKCDINQLCGSENRRNSFPRVGNPSFNNGLSAAPEVLLAPLSPPHCRRLWLDYPFVVPAVMDEKFVVCGIRGWSSHAIDETCLVDESSSGLYRHLVRVCHKCGAGRFGGCSAQAQCTRLVRGNIHLRVGNSVDSGESRVLRKWAFCVLSARTLCARMTLMRQSTNLDGRAYRKT